MKTTCHACRDTIDVAAALHARDFARRRSVMADVEYADACSPRCVDAIENRGAVCRSCRQAFRRPSSGGRPREYCSDECTAAAAAQRADDRCKRLSGLPTYAELVAERDTAATALDKITARYAVLSEDFGAMTDYAGQGHNKAAELAARVAELEASFDRLAAAGPEVDADAVLDEIKGLRSGLAVARGDDTPPTPELSNSMTQEIHA